jgi:hypothetical protein
MAWNKMFGTLAWNKMFETLACAMQERPREPTGGHAELTLAFQVSKTNMYIRNKKQNPQVSLATTT